MGELFQLIKFSHKTSLIIIIVLLLSYQIKLLPCINQSRLLKVGVWLRGVSFRFTILKNVLPGYKPALCHKSKWNMWMDIFLSVCSKDIQQK